MRVLYCANVGNNCLSMAWRTAGVPVYIFSTLSLSVLPLSSVSPCAPTSQG